MRFLLDNTQLSTDVLLMVMLSATMLVAFRLERALGVLRRDRASLEKLVQGFNDSTEQARNGIERLQTAAQSAGRDIGRHIDQARRLESDLQFLISRAEKSADRIEKVMSHGNGRPPGVDAKPAMELLEPQSPLSLGQKLPKGDTDGKPRSQAERDLLMALRAVR